MKYFHIKVSKESHFFHIMEELFYETIYILVLCPLIKMITSPDYINQKIVQNFESSLKAAAISRRSYEYADNYVDILNIINNCDNLEELTLLRQSVVNDLLHATTMQQNIQRSSKGFSSTHHHIYHHHHHHHFSQHSNSSNNVGSNSNGQHNINATNLSKSDQITVNKLKQYIDQLTTAKEQCERNLERHGWSLNDVYDGELRLTLKKILNMAIGRQHLMLFLGPLKATTLVEFYYAVEKLRYTSKSFVYQLASDIFYSYIKVPNPEILIEKDIHKQLESFLVGDVGVDIFYEVQKQVYQTLEEKYYQPFLLSEQCHVLKVALNKEENKDVNVNNYTTDTTMHIENSSNNENCTIAPSTTGLSIPSSALSLSPPSHLLQTENLPHHEISDISSDDAKEVGSYSLYIRKKLNEIQDRIDKKQQALDALRHSMKGDSKILTKLGRDIECLEMAKCQAETQLKRTDIWMENLGKWKANVQNVEVRYKLKKISIVH